VQVFGTSFAAVVSGLHWDHVSCARRCRCGCCGACSDGSLPGTCCARTRSQFGSLHFSSNSHDSWPGTQGFLTLHFVHSYCMAGWQGQCQTQASHVFVQVININLLYPNPFPADQTVAIINQTAQLIHVADKLPVTPNEVGSCSLTHALPPQQARCSCVSARTCAPFNRFGCARAYMALHMCVRTTYTCM